MSADTIICNNSKAILTAVASVDDITWSNGDTGPSIIVEDEGTYTASVANQCGISEDEVTVSLKNCDDYFVPNIFSPNYDGINDYFGPTRSEAIQNIERLAIYNRWGALVFEALNISADEEEKMWDGTFRGQEANPDTYVYLIKLKLVSGKVVVVKGSVNLVR